MQIESVAPFFRSIMPLFATIVWVSGYMLIGILNIYILNWRWFYFIISAPGIFTIAFYWYYIFDDTFDFRFCPETLHWSINNKNISKIQKF